jgi:divalent metal cation (Fe/Co/Zn/Cd) transporter
MKIARERKSSVLASNAVHHRVDSLTGIVTLAAILGANVLENAAWLDPVGGLLISIMVIHAGASNSVDALYELTDKTIDNDVKSSVRKQTQKALADVTDGHEVDLRDVTGIKSGQNYMVDLELAVPGSWNVDRTSSLEDAVRSQVGAKVRGVRRIRVRFVPTDAPVHDRFDEFIAGTTDSSDVEENDHDHDHSHGHDHKHKH